MEAAMQAPWEFADESEFRWETGVMKLPFLAARRISRLGHPITRWIDAAKDVMGRPLCAESRAGLVLAEFRLADQSWEWMEVHTDRRLLEILVAGLMANLSLEPDLSLRKSELADYDRDDCEFLIEGASFRRAKVLSTRPSSRIEFLNRMRRGHWLRVRELFDFEWSIERGTLPLGAQYPGVNFRSWDDLAEVREGDWEISFRNGDRWKTIRRLQAEPSLWSQQIHRVLDGGEESLVRKLRRGDRFIAIYGRNEEGWTEFAGCVSIRREDSALVLRPVEAAE